MSPKAALLVGLCLMAGSVVADPCSYKTQSTCDQDDACTWCLCGALPSKCWTLEDSKKLPSGVYVCDKNGSDPTPAPAPAPPADDCTYTSQSTCNSHDSCTWCLCGALPSKCWTLEDSKKLPGGVYKCDKNDSTTAPAPVAVSADPCSYKTQSTCDQDDACTWCLCGALPSKCWTLEDSKKLPSGVYVCDKNGSDPTPVPAPVDDCTYTSQSTCNSHDSCTWCLCGALPSKCWTLEDSKKLPSGVYKCDKNDSTTAPAPVAVSADPCSYKTQSTCDQDDACTWCLCGALPSKCWTLEDSKKLPSGVYVCDKNGSDPTPVPAPVDDCTYTSQSTCNSHDSCTWCLCGALPSKCWTLEDSKKLPGGVYKCDKNASTTAPAPVAVSADPCSHKTQPTCNQDDACTWCNCGALPSKCWTLEDSKKLPSGVYVCDKNDSTTAPKPAAPVLNFREFN